MTTDSSVNDIERLREWIDNNSPTSFSYNQPIETIWSYLHDTKLPSTLQVLLSSSNEHYLDHYCSCHTLLQGSLEHACWITNYCPRCHVGWERNQQWKWLDPSVELRLLTAYLMKQIVYKMFMPHLPVVIWPHNTSTCPLCIFKSTEHFMKFLQSDYGKESIEIEAAVALSELHYFPSKQQIQPLIEDEWYTIDHTDLIISTYIPRANQTQCNTFDVTMTKDQQRAWWMCVCGELQLECEVQYCRHQQIDSPRFVQMTEWHFRLREDRPHVFGVPSLSHLSKECMFWRWYKGTVPRVKERLATMKLDD